MILRIVILFVVLLSIGWWVLHRRQQRSPLLRVPAPWLALERANSYVGEALRLRLGIVRLLLRCKALEAEYLVADIDRVITGLVDNAAVRLRLEGELRAMGHMHHGPVASLSKAIRETDEVMQSAVRKISDVYAHLLEVNGDDLNAAVTRVREGLKERTANLDTTLEGHREAHESTRPKV